MFNAHSLTYEIWMLNSLIYTSKLLDLFLLFSHPFRIPCGGVETFLWGRVGSFYRWIVSRGRRKEWEAIEKTMVKEGKFTRGWLEESISTSTLFKFTSLSHSTSTSPFPSPSPHPHSTGDLYKPLRIPNWNAWTDLLLKIKASYMETMWAWWDGCWVYGFTGCIGRVGRDFEGRDVDVVVELVICFSCCRW